jgi:hypothetical protein
VKSSEKILFCAETIDNRTFFLTASCLGEAVEKAEVYVEKHHEEDLIESVRIVFGELLEDEESDKDETPEAEVKREKLALVIGRIEGEKSKDGQ